MAEEAIQAPPRAAQSRLGNIFSSRTFWTLFVLFAIVAVDAIASPDFFSIRRMEDGRLLGSLIDILNRSAPLILLGAGMTLVIATRGIDLSVGSVIAISAAVAAVAIRTQPPGVAILLALIAGLVCGLWNGALVALLGIQPIIATLILMVVGRGIAQMITSGQIAIFNDPTLIYIGSGTLFGLPFPIYLALAVFVLVFLFVRRTAIGLMIESVGANDRASYYSGINAALIKLSVYVISGLCAAIAGLIFAGRIRGADANNVGYLTELDAILAATIGGTIGGRFFLVQSIIGVLIIQALYTGILTSGVSPEFNQVVKAVVILIILLLQSDELRQMVARTFKRVRGAA